MRDAERNRQAHYSINTLTQTAAMSGRGWGRNKMTNAPEDVTDVITTCTASMWMSHWTNLNERLSFYIKARIKWNVHRITEWEHFNYSNTNLNRHPQENWKYEYLYRSKWPGIEIAVVILQLWTLKGLGKTILKQLRNCGPNSTPRRRFQPTISMFKLSITVNNLDDNFFRFIWELRFSRRWIKGLLFSVMWCHVVW